ncbi:ferroxidase FET3 [Sugiyamaella lignohabitans]|uniref:Ferroxidase FET3 n=1 Tax=Sugiyamaella lignohabitans TaxID=796027 RepID=A0A167D2U0_9ASCO|nr:ferroxidase FET3 [Sugiyamaella lignohabitans]ANB12409.1 ferroxidase FET3 [Sugiyamaella lignohabitans]
MKASSALPLLTAGLSLLVSSVSAAVRTYDFNVTWVNANPDGLHERQVVGINGQWPLPVIEVDKGDRIIVNMHNGLPDRNASIHFHGIFQNGSTEMDGPVMVTQCPVAPGGDITYNFTVDQNGTYWYHSHVDSQYPDGYRQALIVHDKTFPFDYDEDIFVTLSDWYHETIESIDPSFLSLYNPSGAEPIPDSFLFNDTQNSKIPVKPNTTYMLRIINIGAFVAQYFYIEGHNMTIVEVDGVYTEPTPADILYVHVAQRYTVLFTTKDTTDTNYAIVTVADSDLLDTIPPNLTLNHTNWLEYDSKAPFNEANITVDTSDDLDAFDDSTLIPYDHQELLPDPDYEITVNVSMNNLLNGINYAFFNNITYTAPKVPTLFTVMSANESVVEDDAIYGDFTHTFVLKHNEVVQLVVNNNDGGSHPFHLHGHTFQVLSRSPEYDDFTPFDPNNHTDFNDPPIRRDVLVAHPNGNFVIRFAANNPGVWLFHCHIEWHLFQGLALVLVEAPVQLQQTLQIPDDHYAVCDKVNVSSKGNAAGNSIDFFDLSGQNKQVPDLPNGFTARGIVALVFSCISAFLGMGAIVWYGLSDLSLSEVRMLEHIADDAGIEHEPIDPDDVSNHGGRDD